jgi:hypothetical protein
MNYVNVFESSQKRIYAVVRHNERKMEKYCKMGSFIVCTPTLYLTEKKLTGERKR